jgi:hypothetical protein
MSATDIAAGDDAIYRVSGRRITFTSIIIDVIAVVYTALAATLYFNIIRMNVYQPAMMDPWWTWTPYWRVFGPGILMFTPTFLYLLVFYKRAIFMAAYLGMTVIFMLFSGVCFIFLIVDWVDCENQLWCACVTDYTVTGGSITMTYCDPSDASNASDVFIVHFFVLLAMIILSGVKAALATYIHFQCVSIFFKYHSLRWTLTRDSGTTTETRLTTPTILTALLPTRISHPRWKTVRTPPTLRSAAVRTRRTPGATVLPNNRIFTRSLITLPKSSIKFFS